MHALPPVVIVARLGVSRSTAAAASPWATMFKQEGSSATPFDADRSAGRHLPVTDRTGTRQGFVACATGAPRGAIKHTDERQRAHQHDNAVL